MARTLNGVLLAELEAHWRSQEAEIAGCLAPGLTDAQMQDLAGPIGLRLPDEAQTWWGWHNGVTSPAPHAWEMGPDIGFYSLAEAVEQYDEERSMVNEGDWPASWLPLTDFPHGPLVIDCNIQGDGPVVVQRVNREIGNFPGAPSVGELVSTWIEMMDCGAWSWNPEGYWDRHPDRIPPTARDSHVV